MALRLAGLLLGFAALRVLLKRWLNLDRLQAYEKRVLSGQLDAMGGGDYGEIYLRKGGKGEAGGDIEAIEIVEHRADGTAVDDVLLETLPGVGPVTAESILAWACDKMDERYGYLARANVRNVQAFNQLGPEEIFERMRPEVGEETRVGFDRICASAWRMQRMKRANLTPFSCGATGTFGAEASTRSRTRSSGS